MKMKHLHGAHFRFFIVAGAIGLLFIASMLAIRPQSTATSDICTISLPDQLGALSFGRIERSSDFGSPTAEYDRTAWINSPNYGERDEIVALPFDTGSLDRRIQVYYFPDHSYFGKCVYLYDYSMESHEYVIKFPAMTWHLLVREEGQLFSADITNCKNVDGWASTKDENDELLIFVCGKIATKVSPATIDRDPNRLVGTVDGNDVGLKYVPTRERN